MASDVVEFETVDPDAMEIDAVESDVVKSFSWYLVVMPPWWRTSLWGAPSLVRIGAGPSCGGAPPLIENGTWDGAQTKGIAA